MATTDGVIDGGWLGDSVEAAGWFDEEFVDPVAGGGASTLTADQGTYTLTGQAATSRIARLLVCAQGSYSLTGNAAALIHKFPMVAASGSYTLTGVATGLRAARRITADQGSYGLTGFASGLALGRRLAVAQGGYTFTGQNITLTGASAKVLTADHGTYTLIDQAATSRIARLLAITQGNYVLSGNSADLIVHNQPAVVSAYGGAGHPGPASIWWGVRKHKKFTKNFDWIFDKVVSELYGEITSPESPQAVKKEAAKIVRPYAKDGEKIPQSVNWAKMEQDIDRVMLLLELYQKYYDLEEDDETWIMMH